MHFHVKSLARAGMIAAIYAALTLIFAPISFNAVQFRISEAMTVLPILLPEAVPGLAVGCLVANILGGRGPAGRHRRHPCHADRGNPDPDVAQKAGAGHGVAGGHQRPDRGPAGVFLL